MIVRLLTEHNQLQGNLILWFADPELSRILEGLYPTYPWDILPFCRSNPKMFKHISRAHRSNSGLEQVQDR